MISRDAINTMDSSKNPVWGNWEILKEDSGCDNVLLEHRTALECYERGLLEAIVPLFVGDETYTGSGIRGSYFRGFCAPKPADVIVSSVEAALRMQLDRVGLGTPYADGVTALAIFDHMKGFQGSFLENDTAAALIVLCEAVFKALMPPINASSSSVASVAFSRVTDSNGNVTFVSPSGVTFNKKDLGL